MENSFPPIMMTAENLAARRGDRILFTALSFRLQARECLIVSGANGAGKSTLLRILAGLLPPFEGRAELSAPLPAGGSAPLPRSAFCHYLSDKNAMKPQLSVRENLAFWREFFSAEKQTYEERETALSRALKAVRMESYAELPFASLSTGQKRRIGFCRLLISPRPLWLLDEPTSGLDKAGAAIFAELCGRHLRCGGLIIAATHLPLGLNTAKAINIADYAPKSRCEQFYNPLLSAGIAEEPLP